MYRIVIAEDKPLIRKGIISVIEWRALDCGLVGEASNGQEAIRLIRDLKPDILLTDIKMPYIDGLKLMDYIYENNIPTKVIAISGYDDFSYVRHALSTACVDYILKPISKDDLNRALQRAIALLQSQHAAPEEAAEEESDLLADDLLKTQEASFFELFGRSGAGQPALLLCAWNRYHDYAGAAARLRGLLPAGVSMKYSLFPALIVFALQGLSANDPAFFSRLTEDTDDRFGVSPTKDAEDSISEAYRETLAALSLKFLQPERRVFRCEPSPAASSSPQIPAFENVLLDALLLGDPAAASAAVRKAYRDALPADGPTLEAFRLIIFRLLSIVLKASNICASEADALIALLSSPEQLLELESPEQVIQSHEQIISKTCGEFQYQDSNNMEAITSYINLHFTEALSLSRLAEKFHFSQSYLSSLFKRELGVGINRYIASLRMDYACRLLRSTSLPITEVSERAGYTDYIYFSKAFKSAIGVPPGEYRKTFRDGPEQE